MQQRNGTARGFGPKGVVSGPECALQAAASLTVATHRLLIVSYV
jgi:hypothetical protein